MGYAVSNNGTSWRMVDGVDALLAGETYSKDQPVPPPPTFAQNKSSKLEQIKAECDRRMSIMVAAYPENEQKTFGKQEAEALAYTANATNPTPMINALAASRGIDKADLVGRILAKVDPFATESGTVIGYRQRLEDQVNSAETPAELDAIDPLAGWPE